MNLEELDLADLLARAQRPEFPWQAFRPGVEIHRLWGDMDRAGEAAALLRYAAGGVIPAHRHEGVEEIHVLAGSQRDARGVYPAGSHIFNPPGSSHTVESSEGCVVLVIWQRPNTWLDATGG